MEAVIGPSDILYVPAWLWHCVQNEAPTIGVRCGFIHPRTMLSESFTLTFLRVFASRDRSLLRSLYYQLFKTNLPDRDDWLLTPKLYRN
jgi:ribosomal protein L16 Arg81 hydroxylase